MLACFDQGLDTSARAGTERWNHEKNDVGRPNGGQIRIFYCDGPPFSAIFGSKIWTPKSDPGGVVFLEPPRFSKDGFLLASHTVGLLRHAIVPVSFLFGRHADSCSQLGEASLRATDFCADFLASFWVL